MALIHVDFFSNSLMRTVPIKVILPTDKHLGNGEKISKEKKLFKTLYLLHGVFGSDIDWISGTRVQAWAESYNLAVVMPAGENKFYVDNNASGDNFSKFIGEELVDFTRATFPLSEKREDTFIGGLSMGGYGALINGLKYYQTFGRICAFSSALVIEKYKNADNSAEELIDKRSFYESFWGPFDALEGSDKDYYALADKTAENGECPEIYAACGKQDMLLGYNQKFICHLKEKGYLVTYEEWEGGHDWFFWDQCIKRVMEWLPLGKAEMGISSGHTTLDEKKET